MADLGAFVIASYIDDYGLDPKAFRVYARMVRQASRRQGEYTDEMAKACLMTVEEVHQAHGTLLAAGLIRREGDRWKIVK